MRGVKARLSSGRGSFDVIRKKRRRPRGNAWPDRLGILPPPPPPACPAPCLSLGLCPVSVAWQSPDSVYRGGTWRVDASRRRPETGVTPALRSGKLQKYRGTSARLLYPVYFSTCPPPAGWLPSEIRGTRAPVLAAEGSRGRL